MGLDNFLVIVDVYRSRDEIDFTQYPVFHQVDLVWLCKKYFLHNHMYHYATRNQYFSFTHPSEESQAYFNCKWLKVLSCSIVHWEILKITEVADKIGWWAFGFGLEKLVMRIHILSQILEYFGVTTLVLKSVFNKWHS